MEKIKFNNNYQYIISIDNLLGAWQEFLRSKRNRKDVQQFEFNLMDNIIGLHRDLVSKNYKHSPYHAFNISDPKPRSIHKASVKDRLLHHALYRTLYLFFDKTFIADSYSCRIDKGSHKAINRFQEYVYKESRNHTRTVWVLKCDIRKFFASIDQHILTEIINGYILDNDIQWLISRVIFSFYSTEKGKGLPLGNLTSQLLVNIYMNEFDQFMKHKIKAKHYIRYADDFVILSANKQWLINLLPVIRDFLSEKLHLYLHEKKVSIKTAASGIDFLGWVNFLDHRVLRTTARRRMFKNIFLKRENNQVIQSYLGLLQHGNTNGLVQKIRESIYIDF
ncbi:MAG: reverse transcriptase domain-containing protein [Candidatus Parcubacteria bacterium]|nr:reverse transcriptase domain-containing protein [Candidatus Parcubacteria bacterium]